METLPRARDVYVYVGRGPSEEPALRSSLLILLKEGIRTGPSVVEAELYLFDDWGDRYTLGTTLLVHGEPDSTFKDEGIADRVVSFGDISKVFGFLATFIGRRRGYRELVELASENNTRRLLLRANDVAALHAFSPNSPVLKQLRENGLLKELLGSVEGQYSFFALRKILKERIGYASIPAEASSIRARIQLDHSSELDFVADYEEVLGEVQPITAVIGSNGVGKTRLLLALADAALRAGIDVRSREMSPITYAARRVNVVSFTYEPTLWGSLRRSGATVVSLGIGTREWKHLTSVLLELANSDQDEFQINAYCRAISGVVEPADLFVPVAETTNHERILQIGRQKYLPLLEFATNQNHGLLSQIEPAKKVVAWSERFDLYTLSSGQKSLLLLIAQLFRHGDRSLVLIDEPENHLHPQYVTLLMQTLQSALIAKESRSVIVTHSPFVVRELDKAAVQILGRDADGLPCIYQTSLQTFGGDVGRIADYVFFDRDVSKGYEQRIERAFSANRTRSRTPEEFSREVSFALGDDGELYLQRLLRARSNDDKTTA